MGAGHGGGPAEGYRAQMNSILTKQQISADLRQLGLGAGDTVLVHSSMKSLGHVEDGPNAVIDALLAVLGDTGTLLFPSFQKGSEHILLRNGCVFDVRTSPTQQGLLPETFRQRSGVIRSLSPTHCLAGLGRRAADLLEGHERCSVSVGKGSPFDKLIACRGKILLLGVTHAADTLLHFVENTNGAPTVCRECFQPRVIDAAGREHVVPTYPHMPGLRRCYERVEPLLLADGIQHNGPVGAAAARLVDAVRMAERIGVEIRRNPLFLIEVFTP